MVGPYGWTDIWLSGWLAETLCVSRLVADAVRGMGHRGRSIRVLVNAVNLPSVHHPSAENGGQPRIGVVGRLTGWKGQDLFLEAMRDLAEHDSKPSFWVVGAPPAGSEGFADGLQEIARQAPLAGRVRFTGYLADPMPTIAGLSVLVVSSRTPEPFGRTVVEAMGQAVPVVAPDVGGPAEVVEDGRTGLLYPPNDAKALAQAVKRLLDDPDLARAMGRRGRQVVEDRYRPETHARQVEEIYRHLATVED
jgi:glycosyltransferase involved in cell wall biosynthesis